MAEKLARFTPNDKLANLSLLGRRLFFLGSEMANHEIHEGYEK